jgi:hypothetical protein
VEEVEVEVEVVEELEVEGEEVEEVKKGEDEEDERHHLALWGDGGAGGR